MELITSDGKKYVEIGSEDIWKSLYSTVLIRLKSISEEIDLAIKFFESGCCESSFALETARQINLVRDALSNYPPNQMVYDYENLEKTAPWINNINYVITSCSNLYITADGKDLLYELVALLIYSYYTQKTVTVAG